MGESRGTTLEGGNMRLLLWGGRLGAELEQQRRWTWAGWALRSQAEVRELLLRVRGALGAGEVVLGGDCAGAMQRRQGGSDLRTHSE